MRLQWLLRLDPATDKSAHRLFRVLSQAGSHFCRLSKAPVPQAFFPLCSISILAFPSPFHAHGFLYYRRSNYIRGLGGDTLSRRTQLERVPTGLKTNYAYDSINRMTEI